MATLVRWEPFRELASFNSELSRVMNGLSDRSVRTTQPWVPPLDVWETDDTVVYAFDLPGIDESQVSIEVQDGTLTVSAERQQVVEETGDRYVRFERRFGTFTRAVGLPQGVDEDAIAASYENGVLEITVPKPVEAKPKRITLGTTPPDIDAGS